jgi:alpha-glucosidase
LTSAQQFTVQSFDNAIELNIEIDDAISWNAKQNGEIVIQNTIISLNTDIKTFGENPKLVSDDIIERKELLYPVMPQKNKIIENHYRELQLKFEGGYSVYFRLYNEGIAYRFVSNQEGKIKVISEQMDITFPNNSSSVFPLEQSMYSHYERDYLVKNLSDIKEAQFASLPVLFTTKSNKRILFSDADLFDYPNAFIKGTSSNTMQLTFPKVVLNSKPNPISADRSEIITEEAEYISETDATRSFPWRMFALPNEDKDLLENEMVFKLSRDRILKNVSWIKPGKVAWDWYNANNIWGVDFESGITNETYKYYIDFASKYGIEYVILDEGWTKSTTEILECNPDIEVKALVEYGKEKNVEIILWCLWKPLNENMDQILDLYADWGVKGIKVDFMQRADQYMVNSYTQIAKECAERKLLVDFHGAYKPSGLRKAYPNVISYEGVRGNENHKWSAAITPTHNTTLPFIRMVVGPMDYTPGAMRNAHIQNHQINFFRPVGIGTRAHQVSMYMIFESAIQMLCDTPSSYLKDGKTIDFISQVPSTWDKTIAIDASVGEYVVLARQKADKWYVGAMTNEEPRSFDLDFSFLPEGEYNAEIFRDGPNAGKYAEDYQVIKMDVNNKSRFPIKLARGGGWSAIISMK